MSARRLLVAAGAMVLGACALGPDYRRPDVAQPPQYRLDAGALTVAADSAWWDSFGDPVLNALVDAALRSNYDVRIAAARIDAFRGQLLVARSGLFPQVGLSASATRQRAGTFNGTPFASLDGPRNSYQLLANASWEIDLWGRIRRQAEAAQADLLNAEYARRGVVLALAASVVQGYANLRGLDAQLDVARQTLDARAHALEIFRMRYEGGVVSQLELSQAENDYYATEASIPPLRSAIAQTENALSVLLGREAGPIERGKSITELQAPPVGADLPAALLARRPDVLQAEQNAVAANALLGAAEALYLPAVNLWLVRCGGGVAGRAVAQRLASVGHERRADAADLPGRRHPWPGADGRGAARAGAAGLPGQRAGGAGRCEQRAGQWAGDAQPAGQPAKAGAQPDGICRPGRRALRGRLLQLPRSHHRAGEAV